MGSALAELPAADVAKRLGARVVDPDAVVRSDCGVLAPCAMGTVVNDASVRSAPVRPK
ncbi:hypothetical protein [Streptomyces shaanxiensis]|uniref:Uncharacterized protein n=1 Tax=Streptomyces shaanxiensis TaxID=653357 RepID=A0ABP7W8Z8_9ACTN